LDVLLAAVGRDDHALTVAQHPNVGVAGKGRWKCWSICCSI
jgi:hypothetical protein